MTTKEKTNKKAADLKKMKLIKVEQSMMKHQRARDYPQ